MPASLLLAQPKPSDSRCLNQQQHHVVDSHVLAAASQWAYQVFEADFQQLIDGIRSGERQGCRSDNGRRNCAQDYEEAQSFSLW